MWTYQTSVEVWGSEDGDGTDIRPYVGLKISTFEGEAVQVYFTQAELVEFMIHMGEMMEQAIEMKDGIIAARRSLDEL